MFKIFVDSDLSVLIIILKGKFGKEQAQKLYTALDKVIPRLGRGFTIINDMTMLDEMDMKAREPNEKIMELCNRYGVAKIIRVISDPSKDMGFNIMSLFHYSHDVKIHTFRSFDDVKKYLLQA